MNEDQENIEDVEDDEEDQLLAKLETVVDSTLFDI